MPLGVKPECVKCNTLETPLWHATEAGSVCNNCVERNKNSIIRTDQPPEDDQQGASKAPRKSTRLTKYTKPGGGPVFKNVPKGKGRRHIFKKTVSFFSYSLDYELNFSMLKMKS